MDATVHYTVKGLLPTFCDKVTVSNLDDSTLRTALNELNKDLLINNEPARVSNIVLAIQHNS